MGIQKCKNCGTKFKYKDLLKQKGGVANPVHCNNCGASHDVTWISRFALPALIMLPVFFKNGIRSFAPNILFAYLAYLVYVVIIKALSPYILRYRLKDSNMNKE